MKLLSLVTGFLLISSLAVLTGWFIISSNILTITSIECRVSGEACPTQLHEKINTQLLGTSFFITDFSQTLGLENIDVTSFSKQIPGKISIQVEAKQNQLSKTTFIATDSTEDIAKFVTDYFSDEKVAIQDVQIFQDKDLITATSNNRQILLSIKNVENDATKVVLILKNLDLDTIDLAITEVDARYKLPVLRTTKTQF